MSYGVKYRCEFKDFYNKNVKIDLSLNGYSGTITYVQASLNPLTIEWPSDRSNIFNPVRGAMCTLNIEAIYSNQFFEFFDSYETEWKMQVYYDDSIYWTGWVMSGDFQEPFDNAPYPVQFKAYDLGYLQNIYYNKTLTNDDSIIDIIQLCLANTGFNLNLKERVNIYENSVSSGLTYSILNVINVHQRLFINEEQISCYDILKIILSSFNSFIMQENGVWNVCRVSDMKYEHNYRIFNPLGSISSSGSEDLRLELTSKNIAARTGLYMSCPTWKKLNVIQDAGNVNIIYNGNFDISFNYEDYWTKTGTGLIEQINYIGSSSGGGYEPIEGYVLAISQTAYLTYKKKFDIVASDGMGIEVNYNAMTHYISGVGTPNVQFSILIDGGGGTFYYLQDDGSWGSTALITAPGSQNSWVSGTIISEPIPIDGELSFAIHDGSGSGLTGVRVFWGLFEVRANYLGRSNLDTDYSEEINNLNLNESEEIVIRLGDSEYGNTGGVLTSGSLTLSSGSATNLWQSLSGSKLDKLVQLCADCYKAQYEASTRRIQATIIGQLNYLNVLIDNSKYYLASSMTRDFSNSTFQGEWIEIKTGLTDITGTFVNSTSRPYDDFSTTTGEFNIVKSQTSQEATVQLIGVTATEGRRYRITITIESFSGDYYLETYNAETIQTFDSEYLEYSGGVATTALPEFNFAGNNKDDFVIGENIWEVIATSTTSTFNTFCTHETVTDTCDLKIVVKIEETYGI